MISEFYETDMVVCAAMRKADMTYRWQKEAQITINKNLHSEVCTRTLVFKDGGGSAKVTTKLKTNE
jgi:hypothetical protein